MWEFIIIAAVIIALIVGIGKLEAITNSVGGSTDYYYYDLCDSPKNARKKAVYEAAKKSYKLHLLQMEAHHDMEKAVRKHKNPPHNDIFWRK